MNTEIIEKFLAPEHLRGEAGYAFTNLYGAIQFLTDLDLSDTPESLTISAEEFRKGLDDCRREGESRLSNIEVCTVNVPDTKDFALSASIARKLPVTTVRSARQSGEKVDLSWALKWWENREQEMSTTTVLDEASPPNPLEGLPAGFTRNYGFLTTRPENVRLSELGPLLNEYRLLVRTTETLVAERDSLAWAERKARLQAKQLEVYERAKEVDPSLLPTPRSKK